MGSMTSSPLAARLLDAQVAWLLGRLTGDELPGLVAQAVDDLLELGRHLRVGEVVDAATATELLTEALATVPASAAASTLVGVFADVTYDGPREPVTLADLLSRDQVEAVVDELLGLATPAEELLDRLAESPMVVTVASRFVGRIVTEVLATNKAVADKIPGVGSLMSLGTSMAGKVVGAGAQPFEALFGDTAGKGATYAVRRLNKVLLETLRDPATKEAALQVFDLFSDTRLDGTKRLGDRDDAHRVAGIAQDVAIQAAASAPAAALVAALADGFLAVYAEESVTTLVEDLGFTRDELVGRARAVAVPAVTAAVATGEVERLLRERLEPFFASPAVAAVLEAPQG